jgi:hypothetical protein
LLVVVGLLGSARRSDACGAFAGPRRPSDGEIYAHTPYLAVEQALILWDKETFTEDFIREARFARTGEAFGFVVPTPGLPEISKVEASPFDALRKAYPFTGPRTGERTQMGARRVKLEGPSTNPLRGCLTIALRTLEFPPPGKPAPGSLRLAVTQSIFVPPL